MPFQNVVIYAPAAVDAPVSLASSEISQRLKPTLDRLGIREDLLEEVSGIACRGIWEAGTQPSDAATLAGEKAISDSGIDRSRIGVLINSSVSRDFLEPSTASMIHGNLGLAPDCLNFDVGNACLGFLNGMDIAGGMIERGDVDYAMVVDGETSRPLIDATIERLLDPAVGEEQFREEFASLTLGSGATAMIMTRRDLATDGHSYRGSVTRAATQFSHLCQGNMDRMRTDTRTLLSEGLKLAAETFAATCSALGWVVAEMDQFVIHQVSKVHTEALVGALGLDPAKVHAIYPQQGNIGPASVPMVLARVAEAGKLKHGDRVALLGIGSGLNCAMAEVVW